MTSVRSVSVGIWLRTGARQERVEENGISHFIEHMLFKGTKNRSAEEIARAADSIGGHLDAFTAKETTNFSIKVLDEHLPRAFGILADLVKNPLFNPEHITNESRVIQEEIKMVEDTPDATTGFSTNGFSGFAGGFACNKRLSASWLYSS